MKAFLVIALGEIPLNEILIKPTPKVEAVFGICFGPVAGNGVTLSI